MRAIAWFLIVITMIPGLASAKRQGRLIGIVVDPEGNPIEGVQVTATSNQVTDFREIELTDRKGIFKIDFEVVDVVYSYVFEKVGYQTMKTEQTWSKVGTARHKFVIYPGDDPVVGDLATTLAADPVVEVYNAGAAAFEAKDFEAALAAFEKALELEPELRQAWGAKSAALLELDRYQEAAEATEKAMALGSTSELVLRTRWEAYRNLGDEVKLAEVQADLERIGRLAEEAKGIYNEGVALVKDDQHEGAFTKFKEACELDPNLTVAQLALATAGLEIGRNTEALAAAKAILEQDPGNEQAIRIRFNASLALQDEEELVPALVGLAQVDAATAANGLRLLALAAYDANDMDRAKERFRKLLEIDPNNAPAHYSLGLIYMNEDAKEEAKHHLARFIELAPEDPDAVTAQELVNYMGSS
jgi:tetratricopeptide (TPR) repeat protein